MLLLITLLAGLTTAYPPGSQAILAAPGSHGHNELYFPDLNSPVPGKVPFEIDEEKHYYLKYVNGSENGSVRRSSCPAVNTLANRGYIHRTGRNITWEEIAQASRDIWNFGDDNIILALGPVFSSHSWAETIDLDMLADNKVQHQVNCPAAPTRNDREIGDNVNINMTLLESLLSFTKDNETLTIEDMAEHHHLRHNQSLTENPLFRFGNQDAACAIAQYGNIIGVLGRIGPNGLSTVFVDDVRTFYEDEDIPRGYARRQLSFYSPEANSHIDRMAHYIGFQIERPWPIDDQDGRDVEPITAKYEE